MGGRNPALLFPILGRPDEGRWIEGAGQTVQGNIDDQRREESDGGFGLSGHLPEGRIGRGGG